MTLRLQGMGAQSPIGAEAGLNPETIEIRNFLWATCTPSWKKAAAKV